MNGAPPVIGRLNDITARWLFVLLAGAIAAGLWQAEPLAPAAPLIPSLLAIMIFSVSSSLDVSDFRRAGAEPGLWLRSFLLSYIPFPLMAWAAGWLLWPDTPPMRQGLLLLALVPAANTASVYTGLARGNVAFALTGIALGNLLLPAVLMVFFAAQGAGAGAVSPVVVWRTLGLFLVLPTVLGVALGTVLRARPGAPRWLSAAPLLARACVMGILLLNAAALRAAMEIDVGRLVLLALIVVCMEGVMYALGGWWAARRLPDRPGEAKAFCFLQATRNTALAVALASTALGPAASLPAMVAFLVQEPLAAAAAGVLFGRFRTERSSAY